jgi:hypothetical protein
LNGIIKGEGISWSPDRLEDLRKSKVCRLILGCLPKTETVEREEVAQA